jgi:hypothetical protein
VRVPSRQCRRGPPGHATAAAPAGARSDPAPSAANLGRCAWPRPGSESTDPYGLLAASGLWHQLGFLVPSIGGGSCVSRPFAA